MNKVKLAWGKRPLVAVLSIGCVVLGIGYISWAMMYMWPQCDYFADATPALPTAYAREVVNAESDPSNVLPALDKTVQPVYPAEGYNIGSLTIPALKLKLPILQGTSVNTLKEDVGHFTQSVFPGEKDNCILFGHRETGFKQIGKLKIGDQLIVQTSAGTFTYEVNDNRIVHNDDELVIVPTEYAVLTMTTCYPFNTFGYSPGRNIVSAVLVKSNIPFKSNQNIVSVK